MTDGRHNPAYDDCARAPAESRSAMPEQLSKHPDVTLQVLRSAGAKCGQGEAQTILTACPPDRFCKLPGGEICVYGLPQATQMTQISSAEWQAVLQGVPTETMATSRVSTADWIGIAGAGLVVGVIAGIAIAKSRQRR